MDGAAPHAHPSVARVYPVTGGSLPIQVGNPGLGLAPRRECKKRDNNIGGLSQEVSDPLISFSPETSPSSESSDPTPFSSRFTSTASSCCAPVDLDLQDSSREDLYALDPIKSGRSLSALGILRRGHAVAERSDLEDLGGKEAGDLTSEQVPLQAPLHLALGGGARAPGTARGGVALRESVDPTWMVSEYRVADTGARDPFTGSQTDLHRMHLNDSMNLQEHRGGTRQRFERDVIRGPENGSQGAPFEMNHSMAGLQAGAGGQEEAVQQRALGGGPEEDNWGEARRRRPSSELSRTPPKASAPDPAIVPPVRSQSLSRHRRGSSQSEDGGYKVKFLCSAGGEIKFTDGKLRYVGGETRIFTVSRDITYSELMFKLTEYYSEALSLKYQLPDMDLDTLLSVSSDEDLASMMEEYDEIERKAAEGKAQRLRLFLFSAEDKDGHRPQYGDIGSCEKHFGVEDPLPQAVLRSMYPDDIEQRPGPTPQYGHQAHPHFVPPAPDLMSMDHLSHLQQQPQESMVQVKLPPLHLQRHQPPPTSFSHANSPRRSPTDTPSHGPDPGPSSFSGAVPRLDLPAALTQEHLEQQQQQKLQQLQMGGKHPLAYEDSWQLQHQGEVRHIDHGRQDLPPLHPTKTSPPTTQQERGMLRVRSRDNLSRMGDMLPSEGQPRSATSSPRYEDSALSALNGGNFVDPYSPQQGLPLPPRPPSAGQQGRLGQHTQSEPALDLQEGQHERRLPQPPSLPHLSAGLPILPPSSHALGESASPAYNARKGLGDLSSSPHEAPRNHRRHSAVDGPSPSMADTYLQHPPHHVESFMRQHGQHPHSLPGSPRQMEYREGPPDNWHHDQMMSRFAQQGTSEGSVRGGPEQAAGLGHMGGQGYRGRPGEGMYRWAGDSGYRRVEQGGDMEHHLREQLYAQGHMEGEHGGWAPEGSRGGEHRLGRWPSSQFPEHEMHPSEAPSWMHRSSSQRHLQESDQFRPALQRPGWQGEASEGARNSRPDHFEREFRQDSGARDGLPGLAGPWEENRREGPPEEYGNLGPEAWHEGRRGAAGWGQEGGRATMSRKGSSHDMVAQHRDTVDAGQSLPNHRLGGDERSEAASLLQRRGSRKEMPLPVAVQPPAVRYEEPRFSPREPPAANLPDFILLQQAVSTSGPLPVSSLQLSDTYPALGETPPPGTEALQMSDLSLPSGRPPLPPASPGKGGTPRTPYPSLNSPESEKPAPPPLPLAGLTRQESGPQKDGLPDSPQVGNAGSMAGTGGKPVYLPSPAKAPLQANFSEAQAPSEPLSNAQSTLIDAGLLPPTDLAPVRPKPVSILQQPEPTSAVPSIVFNGFSSPLTALPPGPPIPPLESVLSMDPHFGIPPSLPRVLPPSTDLLSGIPSISESLAETVPLFQASPPQSPTSIVNSGISAAWSAALSAASESPTRSSGDAADWAVTKLAEDMAAAVLQSPLKSEQDKSALQLIKQPEMLRLPTFGSGDKPVVSRAPIRILEPEWGSAGLKMLAESAKGRGSSWGRSQGEQQAAQPQPVEEEADKQAAVVVPVVKGPGFVKIHPEGQKVVSPSLQERVIEEQRLPSVVPTSGASSPAPPPAPAPLPSPDQDAAPSEQPKAGSAKQPVVSSSQRQDEKEVDEKTSSLQKGEGLALASKEPAAPPVSLHSEQLRLADEQMRFQSQSQLLSETPSPVSPEEPASKLSTAGSSAAQAEAAAKYAGLQEIFDGDLELIRELGSGTFGTVHYGKWRGTDVAIKRLKASVFNGGDDEDKTAVMIHSGDISLSGDLPVEVIRRQNKEIADFWKEAELLSSLHHPNVVAFYGVVKDKGKPVATVTEYMVNGSLKQVLQRKDRTIDRKKRILIAMDASFGMEYLHSKHIVHFDLKCDNLLVNMRDPQRPVCKVGDLGLSKIKKKTMCSGGVRGTLPWMAPELLDGNSHFVTEKVDVFSFGIVLWELLTGEEPYSDLHHGAIIGGIVSNTLRPTIPHWCDPAWKALMEHCWAQDQKARPSFKEISDELRAMYAQLAKPGRT